MKHRMTVGRYHLSEKIQFVTITSDVDTSGWKEIKLRKRQIIDLSKPGLRNAVRKYDIKYIDIRK